MQSQMFEHQSERVDMENFEQQSERNAEAPGRTSPDLAEGGGNVDMAKSEIQSDTSRESTSPDLPEGGSRTTEAGGDLRRYLPLYKAALRGDWETANREFFGKDKEAITAIIGPRLETALHVAVSTGKANDFVNKLLKLMPPDAVLAVKDMFGETALHYAAVVGNRAAAKALVNKNEKLLYFLSEDHKYLPVVLAAICGQKDTLEDLISMSKPNVDNSPFEGQLGVNLLIQVIGSDFFDVALNLVENYPNLARLTSEDGRCPLSILATKTTAFPSGERFSWWQRLIYRRIPIKQPKSKAVQSASVAGDVENISCNAPVYKKYTSTFQIIFGVTQKLEFMLWKVIVHLVPQAKDVRDRKVMHQQVIQLARRLCQLMVSSAGNEASNFGFENSILTAAFHGISEIVEEIIETYPMVVLVGDETGRNIFQVAASNRFENVFNLIYNMSDRKKRIFNFPDSQQNNLMHVCAKLAPPDRLNLVQGAALQMQRELQWFKEMEKFVIPSQRTVPNQLNQTPQMLFTWEHKELKEEGEKWMKDTANAYTISAALITTVVFAAAFTVPGGIPTETGIPIFLNDFAFILFAISDAISLFTSVTSLQMSLSILTSRYAEEDFLYVLPKRLSMGLLSLFISVTFMLVAFSAAMYLVLRRKAAWFLILVAAFACLPVASFVLLQYPLLVDVIYSTYGPGIFGKKSDRLLY